MVDGSLNVDVQSVGDIKFDAMVSDGGWAILTECGTRTIKFYVRHDPYGDKEFVWYKEGGIRSKMVHQSSQLWYVRHNLTVSEIQEEMCIAVRFSELVVMFDLAADLELPFETRIMAIQDMESHLEEFGQLQTRLEQSFFSGPLSGGQSLAVRFIEYLHRFKLIPLKTIGPLCAKVLMFQPLITVVAKGWARLPLQLFLTSKDDKDKVSILMKQKGINRLLVFALAANVSAVGFTQRAMADPEIACSSVIREVLMAWHTIAVGLHRAD